MITTCAVIPAYNEESSVSQVVRHAAAYVGEVVVVDDGSTDATAARAAAAGATVLRHDRNLGKGRAVRTGLAYVLARPCSHVLFIDADLQHDPAEIPKLIARAEAGAADLVIAERRLARATMPTTRFYNNVITNRILSLFLGHEIADGQSGFRLIRADLLRGTRLTGSRYEIETEILIKLARSGANIERVTVRRLQYQGARSNFRPVRDTVRIFMLALRYYYLPLRGERPVRTATGQEREPNMTVNSESNGRSTGPT
jgi:glycosyltransferase involved in cell wall biosynthesis